jgi:hypothetical protein
MYSGTGRPHVEAIDLACDVDAVLRGQGLDPGAVRVRSPRLIDVAKCALDYAAGLLHPRSVLVVHSIGRADRDALLLRDDGRLSGSAVVEGLEGADHVAVVVGTLGWQLERAIAAALADDPLMAMALDGLGNAALFALADRVCREIEMAAAADALQAGSPLSPGVGGWPLESGQSELFRLVDAAQVGVDLAGGSQMRPVKSVSMIVGLGPAMSREGDRCERCALCARCHHRRRPSTDRPPNVEEKGRSECDRRSSC